jgi:polysaccharide deacetylase family protein (PEP-CTERM system associated)
MEGPLDPINALTVDFEDWYQGLEIPIERWDQFEDRLASSGRHLLRIFAETGVRGTFFVLGSVGERHPELVREIVAGGHELATHGWSHEFVYRMDPARFRAELLRSIEVLEAIGGTRILGHRAPYFSVTRRSLWALGIVREAGLLYDSSVFPVLNYRYGIEDASRWPYRPDGADGLIEFPISTMRFLGRNVPVGGGAYFRAFPYALSRSAFRKVNAIGRSVVFYVHPWELDPGQPRLRLPRRIALTHYVNLRQTEPRLRRLLREFPFAPMRELLAAEAQRSASSIRHHVDLPRANP